VRWRSVAACPRHATVSGASVQGFQDPTAAVVGLLNTWTNTTERTNNSNDSCRLRSLTLDQAPLGRYPGTVLTQVLEKCPMLSHLAVVGAPLALNQTIHTRESSMQRGNNNDEGAALDFSALATQHTSSGSSSSSSCDGYEATPWMFESLQHLKFEGRQLLGLEALVKRAPNLLALTVKRCNEGP